jgi:hypothetical protein
MMREMNLSKPEDWYGVTTKDFITHGGAAFGFFK